MAVILRHVAQSGSFWSQLYIKLVESSYTLRQQCSPKIPVLDSWARIRASLLIFSRKLTHAIFSLFELCNTARPSQQQLSSCLYLPESVTADHTALLYIYC